MFVLSLVPYGFLPPIIFRNQPLSTIATLVAAGAILGNVLLFGAVVVLGKAGFAFLKAQLFNKLTPPAVVSTTRYRIGLVMFCLPILQNVLETYASHIVPQFVSNYLWVDITMDVMQIASLFVLGENFWDKLRALFITDATAVFPKTK